MMNEMGEACSLEAIRDYIRQEKFRVFALCRDGLCDYICPIRRKCVDPEKTGTEKHVIYRYGAVYDNVDKFGNKIFSKEEMCARFLLNFGYDVKYSLDCETGKLSKL